MEFAKDYLKLLSHGLSKIPLKNFEAIAHILFEAYERDKQIFILGNGGSAAIASHMACDLGKGTLTNVYSPKEKRFRVISLTDNMPLFSALANDIGYDYVFEQQLQNLVQPGDVVIGVSCSGNSPNVLRALKLAKQKTAITIGFVGFDGGKMKELCDYSLHFEEKHYQRCEDAFSIFQHIITCFLAEKKRGLDRLKRASQRSSSEKRNQHSLSKIFSKVSKVRI